MKVLLVDDATLALTVERMIISNLGYSYIIARDGLEAIEKATSERPDLILMDVMMPRMGGIEAVKILRTKQETQIIPIIMVTTESLVEEAYEAGCNDYVTKPIHAGVLNEKIRNLLPEGRRC